jgi:hypothetical protein
MKEMSLYDILMALFGKNITQNCKPNEIQVNLGLESADRGNFASRMLPDPQWDL